MAELLLALLLAGAGDTVAAMRSHAPLRPILCRLRFDRDRHEDGGTGWPTDYPLATWNLTVRLAEMTTLRPTWVHQIPVRPRPVVWVVRENDSRIFQCPIVFASDVGVMALSPAEAAGLRAWLAKGGFLWVDDFWGDVAWSQWRRELDKILPGAIPKPLPPTHELFSAHHAVPAVPQVSNIGFWMVEHKTSERGFASPTAVLQAVVDDHDRIQVLMTFNTDIGDTWEREGDDPGYFEAFAPIGYALGINAVLYAHAH